LAECVDSKTIYEEWDEDNSCWSFKIGVEDRGSDYDYNDITVEGCWDELNGYYVLLFSSNAADTLEVYLDDKLIYTNAEGTKTVILDETQMSKINVSLDWGDGEITTAIIVKDADGNWTARDVFSDSPRWIQVIDGTIYIVTSHIYSASGTYTVLLSYDIPELYTIITESAEITISGIDASGTEAIAPDYLGPDAPSTPPQLPELPELSEDDAA